MQGQHPFRTTKRQLAELDLAAALLSEGREKRINRNDLLKKCVALALKEIWEKDLRRPHPANPAEELRVLKKKNHK